MRLVNYQPSWEMLDNMDDTFGNLPAISNRSIKSFSPAIDIYETEKAVVVETPLAGVKVEDVNVSVERGVLTVQGNSQKEHEVDEKNYYRKEVRSGSFFRQVALPTVVAEDKVEAEFENGILKVTCPKTSTKEVKKINVKVIKKNKK